MMFEAKGSEIFALNSFGEPLLLGKMNNKDNANYFVSVANDYQKLLVENRELKRQIRNIDSALSNFFSENIEAGLDK